MNVLLPSGSAESLAGIQKVLPEYRKSRWDRQEVSSGYRRSRRGEENLARMHQPPVDSLCLQRASTAGMRQPPGGGKYGSSKVASRNGTPNIDRARARVTERRTRTVRISCTSRLRIARTIFRRVIAALTSAKIPRNRRPGRRTTYTQSTVVLGHSLSNFQKRIAAPPDSAAKASMSVPAIGRAQLSHAGHDGCRSWSSFSCFPVIR